jgi:phospholipase/lecithinase/hemolysin
VIAFGDSLSDLGTYALSTEGKTAGKFTTNPGPVWVETVAAGLGTTATAYRHAGWGRPEVILGGLVYAEGGSRVAEQPGSFNTDATNGAGSGQTTMPIREQIALHQQRDRFRATDVVLIWGGPNDLFRHAFFAPAPTPEAGEALVREAARLLADSARGIASTGVSKVVVLTIDDYGEVPAVRATPNRAKLSAWSGAFNEELIADLKGSGAHIVDAHSVLANARADPARFSLKNATTRACTVSTLPFRSVLFCTEQTLVEPNANLTYLYADGVHLTSGGHRLIAEAVLQKLRGAGAAR